MKLNFTRKPKTKMIGIRMTAEEYKQIKELAKKNKTSIAETSAVLIRAALKKVVIKK